MTATKKAGSFRLVLLVGTAGVEIPAHLGMVTRDHARYLKRLYAVHRPDAETRVRKG
jgi:hypothetical protein